MFRFGVRLMFENAFKVAIAGATAILTGTAFHTEDANKTASVNNTSEATVLAAIPQSKKLTMQVNGGVNDLVNALRKQGINFVIPTDELKDRKLNLNFVDVDVDEAMRAISKALGGSFRKDGNIYTFTRNNFFIPEFDAAINSKNWNFDGKGSVFKAQELTPEQKAKVQKSLEEAQKAMEKAFNSKEWKKFWEQDIPKVFTFDSEGLKDLNHKGIRTFRFETLPDGSFQMFKDGVKMSEENMKKFREAQEKALKSLKDSKVYSEKFFSDEYIKDLKAKFKGLNNGSVFTINTGNIEELLKSLTPAQKELHKKQGYLKLSDLTQKQRELLGKGSEKIEGDFTFTYNKDGEKLTIKND